jgi:hypothetical protein
MRPSICDAVWRAWPGKKLKKMKLTRKKNQTNASSISKDSARDGGWAIKKTKLSIVKIAHLRE